MFGNNSNKEYNLSMHKTVDTNARHLDVINFILDTVNNHVNIVNYI